MLKPKTLRQIILLSAFTLVASTKAIMAVDAQAQSRMRSLSAADTRADRFEEKMLNSLAKKLAWKLDQLAPNMSLRLASDKKKIINHFFVNHHVNSVKKNLFASEQYQSWARDILNAFNDSPATYMVLFHELKKYFDDYELATFVLDGLASQKTEAVAKKFYDIQLEDWTANKKDLEVFRALKLDADEGSVFKNPLLETYVSYLRHGFQGGLDEQPIFSELCTMLEHKSGVVGVAVMLGASNVDLRQGSVGNGVMKALFRHVYEETPDASLTGVKFVFNKYAVVDSSAVSIWLSYAEWLLEREDYEKLVADMLNGLWIRREIKVKALATVIAAAQKDESTRKVASNTLEKLFDEWKKEKKTTSDVLDILGLKPAEMKAMDMTETPLLETWFAFESRSHDDDAKLLETLLSQLTEEQLASMIVMETANPIIKERVSSVKAALFNKWKTEFVGIDVAFVRLKLDKAGDKLFLHPALNVWHGYVVHQLGPGFDNLIAQVVKTYYRDPDSLLDMANRELKRNKDSIANSIARILSS